MSDDKATKKTDKAESVEEVNGMSVKGNSRKVINVDEFFEEACEKREFSKFVRIIKSGLKNGTDNAIGLGHFGLYDSQLAYILQRMSDYIDNGYVLPDIEEQEIDEMESKVCELGAFFQELHNRSVVGLMDLLRNAVNDGKILRFPKGFDGLPSINDCAVRTVGKGRNRYYIAGQEGLLQTYASNKRCVKDFKDLIQNVLYTGKIITFDNYEFCGGCDSLDKLGLKYQMLMSLQPNAEVTKYFIAQSQDILDKNEDIWCSAYYLWRLR